MTRPGAVAEWLGRGLQSLVQRFESARRLETSRLQVVSVIFGLTVARRYSPSCLTALSVLVFEECR